VRRLQLASQGFESEILDMELRRPMEKAQNLLFDSTKDQSMPELNRADTSLPQLDCWSWDSSRVSQALRHRNGNCWSLLGVL